MTGDHYAEPGETAVDGPHTPHQGAPVARQLEAGDRVERYEVRRLLGAGGAGRVYAAFDPELDREVALKVLNVFGGAASRGSSGAQRLVREARAMARLSHPNVAEVHHVGEFEGGVVVVMELYPGGTLTEWLFEGPRRWPEIVDKFVAAGRGLAHAHAHGIVHRDFKPDNILLGADGQPRVVDFGLARREDRAPTTASDDAVPVETLEPISGASSMLGTPAYMAPEQHLGEAVDAQADQFGFAVALYEALYGRRPFHGRTLAELSVAVTTTPPEAPPNERGVPRRVWRALRRGMARQPGARWPSMESFMTALGADRARTRRWVLASVGGVSVVAVVLAADPAVISQPNPCAASAQRVSVIWNDDARAALVKAFDVTELPYAGDAHHALSERLDTWSGAWSDAVRQACPMARATETATQRTADLQLTCLNRQLAEVAALLDVLKQADAKLVERAAEIGARIPPATRCANIDQPNATTSPRDATASAAAEALHREVVAIKALEIAGRFDEGLERARALREKNADANADIRAGSHLRLGMLLERTGDYEGALVQLTEAQHLAVAADATQIAIDAGVELVYLVGYRLARRDEGLRWARTTRAIIARAGGSEVPEAQLLSNEATIYERQGRYRDALDAFERALAMHESYWGPVHHQVGSALINIGLMQQRLGFLADAEASLTRAVDVVEATRGEGHPLAASARNNLGIALEHQGRHDEAKLQYQRALEIREAALGLEHPALASPLNNLANIALQRDELDLAITHVRRALQIRERAYGAEHPKTAFSFGALGALLARQDSFDEALRLQRRALANYETSLGPEHPDVAAMLSAIGDTLIRAERHSDALAPLQRALAINRKTMGDDHRTVGVVRLRIGEAHAGAGSLQQAASWFDLARPVLVRDLPPSHPDHIAVIAGPKSRADREPTSKPD